MASDSFSLQNCLDTLHRKQIKEGEEMESKTKGLLNEVRLQFYMKQNTFSLGGQPLPIVRWILIFFFASRRRKKSWIFWKKDTKLKNMSWNKTSSSNKT